MKWTHIAFLSESLLAMALISAGCNPSNPSATPGSDTHSPPAEALDGAASDQTATQVNSPGKAESRLDDAKLYCLGIILYAGSHSNLCPKNLDQALPYLREAKRLSTGTNHFEILYHGSLADLPNPMTNGIVVIRSDAWQKEDGKWTRIYGFADGHCEAHSEAENDFDAWEKEHSLQR